MANRKKEDKFFIYAKRKTGYYKDKRLMGVNSTENLTVKDLVDFLNKNEIDLADVKLPSGFITTVKA